MTTAYELQQPPALSARLRAETRPEHDAIEQALALPQSITSLEEYGRLLAGFHGFYQPLEQALMALDWEGTGVDPRARLKTPLLAADLEACGYAVEAIPRCSRLPECGDTVEGFGCLYVLEGATLGGAMIHRELHARFGAGIEGRARFYQCYGEHRGTMWRHFRQALDQFGAACDEQQQDRVVRAASATFRDLQVWLEGR